MGRCYLPSKWLAERGLDRHSLLDEAHRAELAALAGRLASLAEAYEASARGGVRKLPPRSRWAVLAAASIYGGIAREVVRRGPRAWDSRVVVGKAEKLGYLAGAWREARATPTGPPPPPRNGLWTRPR